MQQRCPPPKLAKKFALCCCLRRRSHFAGRLPAPRQVDAHVRRLHSRAVAPQKIPKRHSLRDLKGSLRVLIDFGNPLFQGGNRLLYAFAGKPRRFRASHRLARRRGHPFASPSRTLHVSLRFQELQHLLRLAPADLQRLRPVLSPAKSAPLLCLSENSEPPPPEPPAER